MSIEDKMRIDERRKYLKKMQECYLQADRKERGQLLDDMEAITELHRKSLIRLMEGSLERRTRRRQRRASCLLLPKPWISPYQSERPLSSRSWTISAGSSFCW